MQRSNDDSIFNRGHHLVEFCCLSDNLLILEQFEQCEKPIKIAIKPTDKADNY